eukprot:CAMPEP_0115606432 /NCGR_PEP_ID=MMETSP0272-20121206/17979_1 /TAXON_ID=71861 /ORGANISM="Scrippsiella trochoidea, Strain CCMP3099" /LENGTH=328 /DNA_ID=CAMNT_0003042063 /DNA_START=14 /DNA_END=997 /DNA_ORIENTATION=-
MQMALECLRLGRGSCFVGVVLFVWHIVVVEPLQTESGIGVPAVWSGAAEDILGYVVTDPATFDPALQAENSVDKRRSWSDCWCGNSRHSSIWLNFYAQLHEGLASDPSFSGSWVHQLCGIAYPVIFRVVSVDPSDDSFAMHSDCPAGILAMVSVCAQSSALQRLQASAGGAVQHDASGATLPSGKYGVGSAAKQGSGTWRHTVRVVREEGASAGDIFGPVPLAECLAECEKREQCKSVAFGPNGCHMKARCVSGSDPVVPEGEQGDDYQTYYLDPCPGSAAEENASQERNTHMDEMLNMMSFALRVLEFCFHCIDASPWPFLLSEVLE